MDTNNHTLIDREALYFKRLLHGEDVSIPSNTKDPMVGMRLQIAKQMKNFSYLIGDKKLKEVLVVDPCWDVDGILYYIKVKH